VAFVGLCSLFVSSLVWMLVSNSAGFSYYLLKWYLCESVCFPHEPNLKGNVKWGMSIRAEYSVDAGPYRCATWSYEGPVAWRYRLYYCMLLLMISVGGDWSVHSTLEFSAIKQNLRIISDMESVFWTVQ